MTEHVAHEYEHPNYVKIWVILCVLLVISIVGPMFEIKVVTLVTAFGIAGVKAYLVAQYFMHLKFEKQFISYLMVTAVVFMLLFFAGTSPDVLKDNGRNWEKPDWIADAAAYEARENSDPDHANEEQETSSH